MTNRNLASNSTKNLVKDVIIVIVAIAVIWISLQVVFGTSNPFYVVSSGSMIPTLEVYDVIVVEGNTPFQDVKKGDIIVFYSPAKYELGEERVIVHRVDSIISEEPRTLQTKGDANPRSMKNVDYPITEKIYLGKVEFIIPQVGYITQILQPPINYIIIAIIIGIMIVKQVYTKKKKTVFQNTETFVETEQNQSEKIDDIKLDSEYVTSTDDLESKDDGKTINSEENSEEK
uniref:Signal peptidase I n=1 Tax=uncultured marine thaumarchaeote KM3_45_E05 TaxID=1456156 RepID=A0A075H5H7_9ARCH|nr:peptidase S26B, signal peptidase (SEC11, sipW) [uncultured marine thaumarchaeote KM3_45_E05]